MHRLEQTLAEQCGPVLLGKKPAALFSCVLSCEDKAYVTDIFTEYGVRVRLLSCRHARTALFVYQPTLLQQTFHRHAVYVSLAKLGYPVAQGVEVVLDIMLHRINCLENYPHEVGFLLGYPPADVVGFMFYGGQHYKHSGMWKVYGNLEYAETLSCEYALCRAACHQHIKTTGSLRSLHRFANIADESANFRRNYNEQSSNYLLERNR